LSQLRYTGVLIFLRALTSCDPVHYLTLENGTSSSINVIYYPRLDNRQIQGKEVGKMSKPVVPELKSVVKRNFY
jgi:hypothetical protein